MEKNTTVKILWKPTQNFGDNSKRYCWNCSSLRKMSEASIGFLLCLLSNHTFNQENLHLKDIKKEGASTTAGGSNISLRGLMHMCGTKTAHNLEKD